MIRVRQIMVDIELNTTDEIKKQTAIKLKIDKETITKIKINKQSLDARRKDKIKYIYEVDIEVQNEELILKRNNSNDILKTPNETYQFLVSGTKKMEYQPIIVGSGPAGLFAAYLLAEHGYKPLVIERGEDVDHRIETVHQFWKNGILNKESNVQFGEGGAGTFSDGKLNTLTKDKTYRSKKVFEIFVKCGAPKEILYSNTPHIGTDLLVSVVKNIRNEIIKMGGIFRYNTCLTNVVVENNKIKSIEVNKKEIIDCDNLILAIGHSARDTFEMLYQNKINMQPKPFAVGVRIEHPQKMINLSQYGYESNPNLPVANYKLTYTTSKKRGVYSFCMCPGGYVVNASSEENMLAINGMSDYKRDSENANSAVVVTVSPDDFGTHPLDGIKFQQELEKLAFNSCNGSIPVQLYGDFKNNKLSTSFGEVKPIFKGNYSFANLNEILPNYICDSLKETIPEFDKKIKGYAREDAIIAGIESRTSSPVRIERNDDCISNIEGIYPIGEGAGYAGGITTAAMDGIRVAEAVATIYSK